MNWYAGKGSGGQGTVIEEDTGRTVAVAYDEKDAALLAAAPELLAALRELERGIRLWISEGVSDEALTRAQAAIRAATGEA